MDETGVLGLLEELSILLEDSKPVFGKGEGATMTAGNSTPLTDGASAVLLGSQEWADAHGLTPLASKQWAYRDLKAVGRNLDLVDMDELEDDDDWS